MSNSQIFNSYPPKKGKAFLTYRSKLDLPAVFFLCVVFFLIGLYGSTLLPQRESFGARPGERRLESVEYDQMAHGETGDNSIAVIPFQVLSWKPRAFYYPKFLSPNECHQFIDMARPRLSPSTIAVRRGEKEKPDQKIRTSKGTFIGASEDETGLLKAMEEKIAKATKIPRNHYEDFNVLLYEIGQKYDAHLDAFDPEAYGPQKSQRIATFLIYLSDAEEGGETSFPYENYENMDGAYDFKTCIGLKVKPRQGDAILFYSLFPNHTIDDASLHTSCPVVRGTKWAATKWIRDQVYDW